MLIATANRNKLLNDIMNNRLENVCFCCHTTNQIKFVK